MPSVDHPEFIDLVVWGGLSCQHLGRRGELETGWWFPVKLWGRGEDTWGQCWVLQMGKTRQRVRSDLLRVTGSLLGLQSVCEPLTEACPCMRCFTWTLCLETSLVVQWLRLCTPNAGARVRSLVRELDSTCHIRVYMLQPKILNAIRIESRKKMAQMNLFAGQE